MTGIINVITINSPAQVTVTGAGSIKTTVQSSPVITNLIGKPFLVQSGAGDYLNYTQSVAAATWTISHNFGKKPNVSVYTVGGLEMWGEVLHTSANVVQVTFDAAVSGFAILS